ncbi:DUF1430 domain-containing protein [Paenibacillus algicola]|uniref:DUF1430 domain-containing protein n=1 Tax=Paenibacillus algicola TaxID=2565926 RepID=UPI0010FF604A|nr:DUF1430 domain-containing protein [Paenibacillus algicola]
MSTSHPAVMANRNTWSYLSDQMDPLKSEPLEHDYYFILPADLLNDSRIIEELKQEYLFFENKGIQENQYKVIYYDKKAYVTAINENNNYGSERLENPVIMYDNTVPESQPLHVSPHRANYIREVMYDITDEAFDQFLVKHQLTESNAILSKTNVMDKFNNQWNAAKKILYINLVFSLLVLILEFMIILSLIKLEYEANAIELSVKKVLGFSVWEKHRKMILITLITTILGTASAAAITMLMNYHLVGYLAAAGAVIMMLELIVIFSNIKRIEKANIQRILKGGNVT